MTFLRKVCESVNFFITFVTDTKANTPAADI